ncbi:hypothetical protein A1sIIA65_00235 [Candidatus Planktophila dulcis]|uniref:hypothetical protein n=1 Tax=Candidatus Planktophila dulcis TaxID=1884914 RepID=UPI000BACA9F9|nr:hypothetical protein [Candidatus Planktophila dulcis]ASY20712.1 hypothetical protein A1sIIA65_00235 [Candidatus Planktophila dulcis]
MLVFHNGGVTQREPEIDSYTAGIRKVYVQDYINNSKESFPARCRIYLSRLCFGILRIPCRLFGLVAVANTNKEFTKLKPWVVSLRGHYSNRTISEDVSSMISAELFKGIATHPRDSGLSEMAIHFRLGDLLHLESKKPLEVEVLARGLELAKDLISDKNAPVFVCSDSVEIAVSKLGEHFPAGKFIPTDLTPQETIYFLVRVLCFVGTPSKISEWVTVFRMNSGENLVSLLPWQMESQLEKILDKPPHIHYY